MRPASIRTRVAVLAEQAKQYVAGLAEQTRNCCPDLAVLRTGRHGPHWLQGLPNRVEGRLRHCGAAAAGDGVTRAAGLARRPTRQCGFVVTLGIVIVGMLIATATNAASPDAASAASRDVDRDAVLVYDNLAGNQTLDPADPQNNSSYAHDSLLAIYDTLVRLDDVGTPGPGLAESWTRAPDLTDITLKLRANVRFHDGTVLTAPLVARNFERAAALGRRAGSSTQETLGLITATEVLDDSTVRLKLKAPNGQIEAWLGGPPGMMMSPAAFADGAAGGALTPIGAGPYKVQRFESNVTTVLARFDQYWGESGDRPAGFTLNYVPDGRARLNAVRSGQATLALIDPRQITEAKSAGLTVQVNEKNAFWVLYPNKARAGLSDVRLRRALMHAIDREALADALSFGSSRATEQVFARSSPFNEASLDSRYPYDPARARALLAEAGHKDGVDITVLMLNNTEFRQLAEGLQAMLADSGIRVRYDVVDVSQFPVFYQPPGRGDMMLGRYGGRSEPVQMLFELVGTGGPFAPGGAASEEIDRLIAETRALASQDPRRRELIRRLVEVISDRAALVPIMTRANVYAFRPGCVRNLAAYLPGGADRFNEVRVATGCR